MTADELIAEAHRLANETPPGARWIIKVGSMEPPPGPLGAWLRKRSAGVRAALELVGQEEFDKLDHGALLRAIDEA